MDLKESRISIARTCAALIMLMFCAMNLHAANLLTATSSVAVTCSTVAGVGPVASIVVKPVATLAGSTTIAVSFTAPGNGLTVTAPTTTSLSVSNQSAGITYTVNASSGCSGASTGPVTIQFKAGTATDVTSTANVTVSSYYLTATSPVAVTCNTTTGPGAAQNIVVKPFIPLTGSNSLAVSFAQPGNGLTVTAPTLQTLSTSNQSAGLTYTVTTANGCVGATTGAVTIQFKAAGSNDVTVTANDTVTASGSGLVVSPVTVTCSLSGSTYIPGPTQTVSVTSSAAGGTPFTVDTSSSNMPTWLVVTPTTGGTATATPVTFTVTAASGCGGFASGSSTTATLHLINAPSPDKLLTVTLQVVPPSIITATPNPATLSYVKGSGTPGYVDVLVSSSTTPAPFFSVSTASLPIWLTVSSTTGTVPKSIRFSTTSVADTLAPGTYSTTVYLKVAGYADLAVPFSLLINNKAPRLTVAEGTTRNLSWTIGNPMPTAFITAVSTDSPIPYTVTTGGTLAPVVSASQASGLAYSFGTQIGVSFNSLIFAAAQPGTVLTGTVTLSWGSPVSTIVVTFNVSIQSPGATISGLTPGSLPTANAGQTFNVVLTGTGFVPGTDPTLTTKVGVVINGAIINDTNIAANVVNPSNIILTITVPAVTDSYLPFSVSGSGGPVVLGICNPGGGTCTIPTGTATLTIGGTPIIQAVTSAAAFTQVTPPAVQTIAPYDMLSIFGSNFCSSSGTGCSSSQILYGSPDAVTLRYPTTLTPDSPGAGQRSVSVVFQTHGSSPSVIASAPLLFATNNQINLLVPGAVFASIGSSVDIVVNFGYASGATLLSSAPYPVNVVATNPGLFTIGADGQGSVAALDAGYNLISSTNPAGLRTTTGGPSDTIQIYMTGLGKPDSTASNASAGSGPNPAWSTDCVTMASYVTSLNTATASSVSNIDGAIVQSDLLNSNRLAPCILSNSADLPAVTIGGIGGVVTYAGFVSDSVAGLFQVNVTLPVTTSNTFQNAAGTTVAITQPVQLPIAVTANGVTSQTGVSVWVQPRLKVTAPSTLSGTVGQVWTTSSVTATGGTSTYRYALTSGLLPSGLSLSAAGAISGTPAANTAGTYNVTVTATDSANIPVKGTVSFTLTVNGGLFVTSSGSSPFNFTFGGNHAGISTVTATGGTFPYTFAFTSPSTVPTGMTVSTGGVVGITSTTPAGTYNVTVTATDAASVTGSASFTIGVAVAIAHGSIATGSVGTPVPIVTMTATGQTGSITWGLTSPPTGVTIDPNTGVITNDGTASVQSGTVLTVTATDGTAAPGSTGVATGSTTVTITIGS